MKPVAEPRLIIEPPGGTALKLSEYLQVAAGSGMDPFNATFTQRVFSRSLLKEGGTLALTEFKLREMQFPVLLSAGNVEALDELVQNVNRAVESTGAVVSWQDYGTNEPTFFDLSIGQLDLKYDYRMRQQAHTKALLRLWVLPFGRKREPRVVATSVASSPVTVISMASPLSGDALALPEVSMSASSAYTWTAISVLPNSAYNCVFGAASAVAAQQRLRIPGGASYTRLNVGDEKALASTCLRLLGPVQPNQAAGRFTIGGAPSAYAGPQRLLGLARIPTVGTVAETIYLSVQSEREWRSGLPGAAPATATIALSRLSGADTQANGFSLVDLGVLNIATGVVGGFATSSEETEADTGSFVVLAGLPSQAATMAFDLTALIVLPEAHTQFITASTAANAELSADSWHSQVRSGGVPNQTAIRGAFLTVTPSPFTASAPLNVAVLRAHRSGAVSAGYGNIVVKMLERTRWVF